MFQILIQFGHGDRRDSRVPVSHYELFGPESRVDMGGLSHASSLEEDLQVHFLQLFFS